MTDGPFYGSPRAFRRALTDKLKAKAETSRWTLQQLQRQIAYDRLLERLYLAADGWIIKGAAALLARDIGVRATLDIDVYRRVPRDVAEAELREAASKDIGDWFRFEIGPSHPVMDGAGGVRLPVIASVGTNEWVRFHVDLIGSDLHMTGEPEIVAPLAQIVMPDIQQHGYRVYPLVDHIADKVAAMIEVHGQTGTPSTRYKDLVDLVAIVVTATVDAKSQAEAIRSEAERRGLHLPNRFLVPDQKLWEQGYAAEAKRSLLEVARTLEGALGVVRPFLDPLLGGTACGTWDPQNRQWAS